MCYLESFKFFVKIVNMYHVSRNFLIIVIHSDFNYHRSMKTDQSSKKISCILIKYCMKILNP